MANEKTTKQARIEHVRFRDVASGIAGFPDFASWSYSKHAKKVTCVVDGNWVILAAVEGGERVRIPMTNVASISEASVTEAMA